MSIAFLDVGYHGDVARIAAVVTADWQDAKPALEKVLEMPVPAPYQPGAFYQRELPCLLAMLGTLPPVGAIVIDGYVWLDAAGAPGLGAHLHVALNQQVPVIGVAKTAFRGSAHATAVLRGKSAKPLYVTATDMDIAEAAQHVQNMHGTFRLPEILKRVDYLTQLCNNGNNP